MNLEKMRQIAAERSKKNWPTDFARTDYPDEGAMAMGPVHSSDPDTYERRAQRDQNFIVLANDTFDRLLDVAEAVKSQPCFYCVKGLSTCDVHKALKALEQDP